MGNIGIPRVPSNNPFQGVPAYNGAVGAGSAERNMQIFGIALKDLSPRMQLFIGSEDDILDSGKEVFFTPNDTNTRGRVRLVTYQINNTVYPYVKIAGDVQPNLDPPSFLFLQMSGTGTKSRILGQQDERGGFAIPTPQNAYRSNYVNLPGGLDYHPKNARFIPAVKSAANPQQQYDTIFMNKPQTRSGVGFNYDYIPLNSSGLLAGTGVYGRDNYNLIAAAGPLSSLLKIGFTDYRNERPLQKFHRQGSRQYGGEQAAGFGTGPNRHSSVFTVSMIEPNFVYTSTENVTIQTFHLRLLWGDTSEVVEGEAPNPVQFSLVASP